MSELDQRARASLPAVALREAAAGEAPRAMCEQSYGEYLGVPFGQSFRLMEAPLLPVAVQQGGWVERLTALLGNV